MSLEPHKRSPFKFDNFFIVESSIKRKPIVEKKEEVEIQIGFEGVMHESNKKFELILSVKVFEKNGRFEANVKAIGIFSFQEVTKKEDISDYFYVNAPAIIFPYIRSYISALTSLSGLETINLPIIVMGEFKKQLEDNTTIDPSDELVN